ncbi:HNH endonuclease [Actinomycetaceae bacterium MB13-C1-2]|nr:HNH endonuclease [Actinomycetaceae bacterium MB13-C1-2]
MNSLDAKAQLEEILNKDSVEITVRGGKTLISTIDLFAVLTSDAWFIDESGYVKRSAADAWGNNIYLHNLIVGDKNVDHANGNKLDNRRENLRVCTQADNSANRKVRADSETGYKGVNRTRAGTFHAQASKGGVVHNLGTYPDPESAARAYDEAAINLFGEYAATNFPREGYRWAREHLQPTIEESSPID